MLLCVLKSFGSALSRCYIINDRTNCRRGVVHHDCHKANAYLVHDWVGAESHSICRIYCKCNEASLFYHVTSSLNYSKKSSMMAKKMQKIKKKLYKTYMKLLKASVKHNNEKIAKLESKLIALELELKDGN